MPIPGYPRGAGFATLWGAYWFRRGRRGRNSGQMRLTSLKWATYKLKNNDNVVLALLNYGRPTRGHEPGWGVV